MNDFRMPCESRAKATHIASNRGDSATRLSRLKEFGAAAAARDSSPRSGAGAEGEGKNMEVLGSSGELLVGVLLVVILC